MKKKSFKTGGRNKKKKKMKKLRELHMTLESSTQTQIKTINNNYTFSEISIKVR